MTEIRKFSKTYRAIILILIATVIGGGAGVFAKISLKEIPPITFTLLRFLLAIGILLPFILRENWFRFGNLKQVVLVSLLATANVTIFVFGIGRTTATISQMLYAGVPLIAGIFSYYLLQERLNSRKILGILIGFIGVLVIVLLPVIGEKTVFNGDLLGNLIIFTAVFSFALYSVFSKQFQQDYSPLQLTIFFVLTTTIVQLLLIPFELKESTNWWSTVSPLAIFGLLYVGVLGTGVYYLIYQYAIKVATPVMASMILYLQPISAFAWASLLLDEKITPEFIVGAILAFIGVALVTNFGRLEEVKS